ncbi:16S rRNA (uracil(1498)-N(3))-methyltransferase [Saccharomonospora xinjiangensis]|uniref:Ribosomal RNA small subunit methyltransferase E n=1 Tax=Saccharomonospora xinjiangensis XJ-54 TaxID=882086 RepID=I0UYC3_9PSEU|nr:16S rRNA (uracil(1498)-N(3))-methyltransferase [Saccharomonospora xinjiangensis]EID52876.1 RNA methyltransferase, RsmE family [Saccharomonospora xinjiangensis XJ-54]
MAGAAGTTPPVFLVPELPEGEFATLDGEEAHHAVTVRRLRTGERLTLSDGHGGVADCVTVAAHPGRKPIVELRVVATRTVRAPALRVTVVQALAKGDRGELAVELATEAGADAIVPWRAARSVVRWDDGARTEKALGKWRGTARAAAKQARRAWLPEVAEPVTTRDLAAVLSEADLALVLDGDAQEGITEVPLPSEGELVLVVGPEGGVAPEEFAAFTAAGARRVRLGPTVLRTSTAAAVALGALGALTARWA